MMIEIFIIRFLEAQFLLFLLILPGPVHNDKPLGLLSVLRLKASRLFVLSWSWTQYFGFFPALVWSHIIENLENGLRSLISVVVVFPPF
jgi:hypothetical protein